MLPGIVAARRTGDDSRNWLERTPRFTPAHSGGIPAEDARFVLPNAAPTNFHVMVNFAEMLHICE